jgi:hypothetical protein
LTSERNSDLHPFSVIGWATIENLREKKQFVDPLIRAGYDSYDWTTIDTDMAYDKIRSDTSSNQVIPLFIYLRAKESYDYTWRVISVKDIQDHFIKAVYTTGDGSRQTNADALQLTTTDIGEKTMKGFHFDKTSGLLTNIAEDAWYLGLTRNTLMGNLTLTLTLTLILTLTSTPILALTSTPTTILITSTSP